MFCFLWGSYWCLLQTALYSQDTFLSFHLAYVRILGSMECETNWNNYFEVYTGNNHLKLNKDYAEKFSKTTGI